MIIVSFQVYQHYTRSNIKQLKSHCGYQIFVISYDYIIFPYRAYNNNTKSYHHIYLFSIKIERSDIIFLHKLILFSYTLNSINYYIIYFNRE